MNFINHTIFPAINYEGADLHDDKFHVVASRVTYDIRINNRDGQSLLVISPEQQPLNYTDVSYNETIDTSIEYESDLAPYKPKTDIVINATAFVPENNPVPVFDVGIQIGKYLKALRIFGPRNWIKEGNEWLLTESEPISYLDIRYEYAFGGTYTVNDDIVASPANPIGMGWYPASFLAQCNELHLPANQIESPNTPVEHISQIIRPDGLGFFGRNWLGRTEYAGAYHQEEMSSRQPKMPENFHYWCGAHPTLQIPHLKTGNKLPLKLFGLLSATEIERQHVSFYVPVENMFVFIGSGLGFSIPKNLQLDTVVVDMNLRKVFCTYRIALPGSLNISEMTLRHIPENSGR